MEPIKLCRSSYLILGILRAANAADKIHGLTINEIRNYERLSKPNTIHKKIKALESSGYIHEGVKAGRAKTYYLTNTFNTVLPKKQNNLKEGKLRNEKQ
jgi:SOS-response transcriptional repressor LexA